MLIDTQIIQRHGALSVIAQRQEILFKFDGSSAHLHPVLDAEGARDLYLRAVQTEGFIWHVFDLRDLVPAIADDLLHAHDSDRWGIVFYTLRQEYPTAAQFLASMRRSSRVIWWRHDAAAAVAA